MSENCQMLYNSGGGFFLTHTIYIIYTVHILYLYYSVLFLLCIGIIVCWCRASCLFEDLVIVIEFFFLLHFEVIILPRAI